MLLIFQNEIFHEFLNELTFGMGDQSSGYADGVEGFAS